MSDKMLHERMRDAAPQLDDRNAGLTGDGYSCAIMMRDDLLEFADEIERDYITRAEHEAILREKTDLVSGSSAHWAFKAWADAHDMPFEKKQTITEWLDKWFHKKPLDENGSPWNIGDDCTQGGEDATVVGYRPGEKVFIDFHDERIYARCRGGDIKRQANKTLDADGVGINVGDTVYNDHAECENLSDDAMSFQYTGPMTVDEFNDHRKGYILVKRADGTRYDFSHDWLTHQKPVFGADGVRICAGDTVYLNEKVSGTHAEPCVVARVTHDGTLWWEGGGCAPARLFTSKEPDSLDKLLDYVREQERQEYGSARDVYNKIADRLTAIIERGV